VEDPAATPGPRAADLFVADLRPRPGGPALHVLRIAGAFLAQLAWQLIPSPAVHDVVVTRRRDGAELLRLPAEDPLVPGELLAYIRGQLDEMDPTAFLAEWRLEPLPE
jgi:hypothetical protein